MKTITLKFDQPLRPCDELFEYEVAGIDDLKTSVQNAAYEQKDPLVIYKQESFNLFESMLLNINRDISSFLIRASLPIKEDSDMHEARQQRSDDRNLKTSREDQVLNQRTSPKEKPQPVHVEKKVGRNDPCPCGSGKKYKNCHGRNVADA